MFADDTSGFGPLTAAVMEELAEDFASRPRLLFSLRPTAAPVSAAARQWPGRRAQGLSHVQGWGAPGGPLTGLWRG